MPKPKFLPVSYGPHCWYRHAFSLPSSREASPVNRAPEAETTTRAAFGVPKRACRTGHKGVSEGPTQENELEHGGNARENRQ